MKKSFAFFILITVAGYISAQTPVVTSRLALEDDTRGGYFFAADLTYGFGLGETAEPDTEFFTGFSALFGYQSTRTVKSALGIGVSLYDSSTLFPVYGHVQYSIWARRVVPFFYADGGYLVSIDDFKGNSRFFLNPGIGLRMVAADRFSVNVSGGIMHQSAGVNGESTFVTVKLGLELKDRGWNRHRVID